MVALELGKQTGGNEFQGVWGNLCQTVNRLFESILLPVNEIEKVLSALASGDLTKRCEVEARGDIERMVTKLNIALENQQNMLNEINTVATTLNQSSNDMLTTGQEMSNSTGEISSAVTEMSNGARVQLNKVDESSSLIEMIQRIDLPLK